jgi:mRNA interferase HigB
MQEHPNAKRGLEHWLLIARDAEWTNIRAVRQAFPHADAAEEASGNTVTIFNIAGNRYRLVVSIKYRYGMVFVRDFLGLSDSCRI